MAEKRMRLEDMIRGLPEVDCELIHQECISAVNKANRKVVVLDDDPTGTQVVHDIPVITKWDIENIRLAFRQSSSMFFILTNSRGMSSSETAKIHRKIADHLMTVISETGREILLISRSDSTLRGHYPLETSVVNEERIKAGLQGCDGEIIVPFFPEGGRYTLGDIHYIEQDGWMIPAAETEFAHDRTFPYSKSNLREWIEEKTRGAYSADKVCSFSVEELRIASPDLIEDRLMGVSGFGKIIVNAVSYTDLELFVIPLMRAIQKGKHFLFRSAASLTKVLGMVSDRELLRSEELRDGENRNGGLIVVGSHVQKTTMQLPQLCDHHPIMQMEFDVHCVFDAEKLLEQQRLLAEQVDRCLAEGRNVLLYTSRKRLDVTGNDGEADLLFSTRVSEALADIVRNISVRPRFILAKGGITSSDIATKGLGIEQAMVMGQILKGVPVWKAGNESKFPGLPYIVFPGNVGDENALRDAYEKLV